MSEFIITSYKRLFEVRIMHHYFLDDGAEDYCRPKNPIEPQADYDAKLLKREKNLRRYDIRKVLRIRPTPGTDVLLGRLRGVFRQTATGFFVAVPPTATVPGTARFDFVVAVEDGNFFQYTGLPFFKNEPGKVTRNQKIVEVRHDNKVYRYKPNVFVFGNKHGASRKTKANLPADDWFFLNNEIPTYNATDLYLAEWLVRHDNSVYRAMRDKPVIAPAPMDVANNELLKNWQHLSFWWLPTTNAITPFDAGKLPPYVNQGDIPDIVPLEVGVPGVPAKGILLTDELPDDILALVQIEAMPPRAEFQLLTGGQLRTPHPVFDLHFKNRAAYWRFFSKNNKKYDVLLFNPPRGLTAFGNAMISVNNAITNPKKPYPVAIEMDANPAGDLLRMLANVPQITDTV